MSLNRKRCLNTKRFLFIDGAGFIVGERFLSESFQCASDNLLKMISQFPRSPLGTPGTMISLLARTHEKQKRRMFVNHCKITDRIGLHSVLLPYDCKLYRYKIKPSSKTKGMTYLDPDTFMNNIKSCKFLKINDYSKSLPFLPVPLRYKGGRGGGETVDQLREVWDVEPGLRGEGGGGLLVRAGPAVIGFTLLR